MNNKTTTPTDFIGSIDKLSRARTCDRARLRLVDCLCRLESLNQFRFLRSFVTNRGTRTAYPFHANPIFGEAVQSWLINCLGHRVAHAYREKDLNRREFWRQLYEDAPYGTEVMKLACACMKLRYKRRSTIKLVRSALISGVLRSEKKPSEILFAELATSE